MARRLFVNPDPCTACLNCMAACAQHNTSQASPHGTVIRVEDEPFTGLHQFIFCRQCHPRAACAEACPVQAIHRNPGTGAWLIDRNLCIRCGTCVASCPFDAMFWLNDAAGPLKCDLCGGDPCCVKACHFCVIRFGESDDPAMKARGIPAEDQDALLGRGE